MRIFFAGPLTNLEQPERTKAFYEQIDVMAKKLGYDTFWAFKSGTDPVKDPNIDPEYIYNKDLAELEKSNLMMAYVGEPTTGTGQELEYAHEHNIPIYLFHQKDQHVSRMVIGNPAVNGVIVYNDETDGLMQIQTLLTGILTKLSQVQESEQTPIVVE